MFRALWNATFDGMFAWVVHLLRVHLTSFVLRCFPHRSLISEKQLNFQNRVVQSELSVQKWETENLCEYLWWSAYCTAYSVHCLLLWIAWETMQQPHYVVCVIQQTPSTYHFHYFSIRFYVRCLNTNAVHLPFSMTNEQTQFFKHLLT